MAASTTPAASAATPATKPAAPSASVAYYRKHRATLQMIAGALVLLVLVGALGDKLMDDWSVPGIVIKAGFAVLAVVALQRMFDAFAKTRLGKLVV